jgi:hypothetical protein
MKTRVMKYIKAKRNTRFLSPIRNILKKIQIYEICIPDDENLIQPLKKEFSKNNCSFALVYYIHKLAKSR